ncbi:hypothetical protein C8Q77DRAFT_1089087 [Trametes polyzona]|nr:hypothetical protein C8Q77DRAFT_1089087 [Trametes polyzona]
MAFTAMLLAIAACLAPLFLVSAMPSFEGVTSWSSMNSLVPGMTHLQGLGPIASEHEGSLFPFYMSIAAPRGLPGNVTVYRNKSPPLYYIHQNQLWHYHNDSTILPINVHNSTAGLPLQLIAEQKPGGVPGGRWRWQGTMLFYENGPQNNQGLFYSCQDVNGLNGLFLFLQCSPPPAGCTPFTIHSFSSNRLTEG